MTEEEMPERKTYIKRRRKRTNYSTFDIIFAILAVVIFGGAIYYFFIMDQPQREQGITKIKSKGQKNKTTNKTASKIKTVENNADIGTGTVKEEDYSVDELENDRKDDNNEVKDGTQVKSDETLSVMNQINLKDKAVEKPSIVSNDNSQNDLVKDPYEFGELPVFFEAIKSEDTTLLSELIKEGLITQETSENGFNALHYAASLIKVDAMRLLLDANLFDISAGLKGEKYSGYTALHFVCSSAGKFPDRAIGAVHLLLDYGADIKATDDEGFSPIFNAVEGGNIEVAQIFLDKGESVNSATKDSEDALLHFAMKPCNRPMIKFLIDNDADIHAVSGSNREPIHEAAAVGCVDGLKELILKSNVSKQTKTPLKAENKCKSGYEEYCLFGATPLHFAANFGKIEAVEFLFLIQAEFHAADEDKKIPYTYACGCGNSEIEIYFYERNKWEIKRIFKPNIESYMRRIDRSEDPEDLELYKYYKGEYLHKALN